MGARGKPKGSVSYMAFDALMESANEIYDECGPKKVITGVFSTVPPAVFADMTKDERDQWDFPMLEKMHRLAKALVKADAYLLASRRRRQ